MMYVLFDTNIWNSQLGLTTRNAAAVRFFLLQRNATIAIPEVVHLELAHNLVERLKTMRAQIQKNHKELLSVFGSLHEVSLPSNEEIETRVESLLTKRDIPHIFLPFSFPAARSSLRRIIEKKSPSRGKEQFVDGVIWSHCLDLLEKADVCLVTADSAFYDSKVNRKLASDLVDDISGLDHSLKLFRNLDELLDEVRTDVRLDETIIRNRVFDDEAEEIGDILVTTGYRLVGEPDTTIRAYITEVATQINLSFDISQPCEEATTQGRESSTMTIKGDGFFDLNTNLVERLRVFSIRLRYRDVDGELKNRGSVRGWAEAISIGPKKLQHTLKIPIDSIH